MVNLRIVFEPSRRVNISLQRRHELNEHLQVYDQYIQNHEGGFAQARRIINDRIYHVLRNERSSNLFFHTGATIRIAPQDPHATERPYTGQYFAGDTTEPRESQLLSEMAWQSVLRCCREVSQTVVARVELVPFSDGEMSRIAIALGALAQEGNQSLFQLLPPEILRGIAMNAVPVVYPSGP